MVTLSKKCTSVALVIFLIVLLLMYMFLGRTQIPSKFLKVEFLKPLAPSVPSNTSANSPSTSPSPNSPSLNSSSSNSPSPNSPSLNSPSPNSPPKTNNPHVSHCPALPSPSQQDASKLVMGGMSFIGSRLSLHLHENNVKSSQVVEDIANVDEDDMKWYRWTELTQKGVQLNIRDYSDSKQVSKLLDGVKDVVYIPSILFDKKIQRSSKLIAVLKNFIATLDIVKKSKDKIRLIVLLPRQHVWSQLFQYAVETYIRADCIYAAVVQLSGVYGPWQNIIQREKSLYIDDVLDIIDTFHRQVRSGTSATDLSGLLEQSLSKRKGPSSDGISSTLKWLHSYSNYTNIQQSNVAFSATLRDIGKYQHTNTLEEINPANLFRYFMTWLTSAVKVNMSTVIFSDSFNDQFIERAVSRFKRSKFLKATAINTRSPNDQRFYMTYNYLLTHPEIMYAIVTDTRDVRFVTDPTTVMKAIGDYYYIGSDVGFLSTPGESGWIRGFLNACLPKTPLKEQTFRLQGFFNCGVLGGTRSRMLNLLSHLINLLDKTDTQFICDMPTLEVLSHTEDFYDSVYYGYPYNMAFKGGIPGPFGIAIKHKD